MDSSSSFSEVFRWIQNRLRLLIVVQYFTYYQDSEGGRQRGRETARMGLSATARVGYSEGGRQ